MSYTSTYQLYKTKVITISEHRNSWGCAPMLWDYISLKARGMKFLMFEDDKEFWRLWKSPRLDDDERAVLLSTYDRSFVEMNKLNDFANACRKVHKLIIESGRSDWNHFAAIADDAESLANKHDYRCIGFAIGCTSVCDEWDQQSVKKIDSWAVYGQIKSLHDKKSAQ